jgi:acyl CoA:acetate/3-ketoacid CoA transferase beta subunit
MLKARFEGSTAGVPFIAHFVHTTFLSSLAYLRGAGLVVTELAEGVTFEEVQSKTQPKLHKAASVGVF